ncbi:MAG: hypothetical protein UY41_C0027G0017 [Candidatus Moranbacteria bacterium GW2011_GWE1_49_15]|nr:MAG: hypothetical protein UY41_C0027G0017 [Candidatus Moranbacteria bacterium GW2011_GWE1_49_15]
MNLASKYVLKIGIGATFIATGVLILKNPEGWALMIKLPRRFSDSDDRVFRHTFGNLVDGELEK